MLAAMCETQAASPRDVSSLSWLSHGASPVALEVLRRADELFACELIHLYGATELSPLATVFRHEERYLDSERAESCGQAPPGIDIQILGSGDLPLPSGRVGEQWGEQVHAVIMPRDGHDVTADELLDHCRHRIAGYRVPKSMSFQDDPLPKSGPGKVLKRVLREPYWEGRDRAI